MNNIAVVIPAAGSGRRMQSTIPKQYLTIKNKTVLEHTVQLLADIEQVTKIILVVNAQDSYIAQYQHHFPEKVTIVTGGQERVNSVLAGLHALNANEHNWVMVHDAARPCVLKSDILKLIDTCIGNQEGGILATPVRDTMKREQPQNDTLIPVVGKTEDRSGLWHALTPQMFMTNQLITAIEHGLLENKLITDEASAIELLQLPVRLIEADESNIKITRKSDLALAEFFLNRAI